MDPKPTTNLGLKANWQQFSILVLVNAFVGAMIGLERSIIPDFAAQTFQLKSTTSLLLFIAVFGASKALANYYSGQLATQFTRKKVLVLGWLIALPVPILFLFAQNWVMVILANVFLGVSQGFTWSSTVVMKIDLAGPKNRGLAMGINEFAGYLAVGLMAYFSSYLAQISAHFEWVFYTGFIIAITALFIAQFIVKDTVNHVINESNLKLNEHKKLTYIFYETSFTNPTLSATTQAGFVNNLNDGMLWGLLPLLLLQYNFTTQQIGLLIAIYPTTWGLGQLVTGKLADHYKNKLLLSLGMAAQALSIFYLVVANSFTEIAVASVGIGLGTALVYPTFLTVMANNTHPEQRPLAIGVFRLWRDSGYVAGALITGLLVDFTGLASAVQLVGGLTFASALVIVFRMDPRA